MSISPLSEPPLDHRSALLVSSSLAKRKQLRRDLRQRRRALTPAQQRTAAAGLCRWLKHQPLFIRSRHIAFYLPNDGEIDPRPLLEAALACGKRCYLPVLKPGAENRLWFVRFDKDTSLHNNRFGIPEPRADYRRVLAAEQLDLVLMPLVGFDTGGGRMGMGGGFYDRTFEFKHHLKQKTYLLGLAHSCQQVEKLEVATWDIPLSAIATERGVQRGCQDVLPRDFIGSALTNNKVAE